MIVLGFQAHSIAQKKAADVPFCSKETGTGSFSLLVILAADVLRKLAWLPHGRVHSS